MSAALTREFKFQYSAKYTDELYEYRHVVVPLALMKLVPKGQLMSEAQWRAIGVTMSPGWVHYAIHQPEQHILLFKRPLPTQPGPD